MQETQEMQVWCLSQGRSPGVVNGNHQYSCLENAMDRGAWWARIHGVTKSQTWLSMHFSPFTTQKVAIRYEVYKLHIAKVNPSFIQQMRNTENFVQIIPDLLEFTTKKITINYTCHTFSLYWRKTNQLFYSSIISHSSTDLKPKLTLKTFFPNEKVTEIVLVQRDCTNCWYLVFCS